MNEQEIQHEKELEDYNNRIKKLTKDALKHITRPFEYQNKVLELVKEGRDKGFITNEDYEHHISKFHHDLNSPSRMKSWVQSKLEKVKRKIKPSQLAELKQLSEKEKQNATATGTTSTSN